MLQPTDWIDLSVGGLMGTDNSVAQEVEEEKIDGYQGFWFYGGGRGGGGFHSSSLLYF